MSLTAHPNPLDLFARMLRVKRLALLLFFGGGAVMAFLSLLLPTQGAPDPQAGHLLFALTGAVGLGLAQLLWHRPGVLKNERFDWLLMLSGNLSALLGILGETLMFGSQLSTMVILWPMVFAAGFLSRKLLWWQVVFSTLCVVVITAVKAALLNHQALHQALWLVDVIVLAVPVAFTGISISFFREAATTEALELSRMVATDPLTGLSNRREIPKQFAELLRRSGGLQVAVIMLDLDHFKAVNDRFGHQVGDTVLEHFAQMLRDHARSSDLVARLGGEEFMWITTAHETQELIFRSERLRESFGRAPQAREVTVSVGLACWSGQGALCAERLPDLMQVADQALYQAKARGRDQTCTGLLTQ